MARSPSRKPSRDPSRRARLAPAPQQFCGEPGLDTSPAAQGKVQLKKRTGPVLTPLPCVAVPHQGSTWHVGSWRVILWAHAPPPPRSSRPRPLAAPNRHRRRPEAFTSNPQTSLRTAPSRRRRAAAHPRPSRLIPTPASAPVSPHISFVSTYEDICRFGGKPICGPTVQQILGQVTPLRPASSVLPPLAAPAASTHAHAGATLRRTACARCKRALTPSRRKASRFRLTSCPPGSRRRAAAPRPFSASSARRPPPAA